MLFTVVLAMSLYCKLASNSLVKSFKVELIENESIRIQIKRVNVMTLEFNRMDNIVKVSLLYPSVENEFKLNRYLQFISVLQWTINKSKYKLHCSSTPIYKKVQLRAVLIENMTIKEKVYLSNNEDKITAIQQDLSVDLHLQQHSNLVDQYTVSGIITYKSTEYDLDPIVITDKFTKDNQLEIPYKSIYLSDTLQLHLESYQIQQEIELQCTFNTKTKNKLITTTVYEDDELESIQRLVFIGNTYLLSIRHYLFRFYISRKFNKYKVYLDYLIKFTFLGASSTQVVFQTSTSLNWNEKTIIDQLHISTKQFTITCNNY